MGVFLFFSRLSLQMQGLLSDIKVRECPGKLFIKAGTVLADARFPIRQPSARVSCLKIWLKTVIGGYWRCHAAVNIEALFPLQMQNGVPSVEKLIFLQA